MSNGNTGSVMTGADMLWTQALTNADLLQFQDAIVTYKYLFDNYPSYSYNSEIVYELYGCYQALDTSSSEMYRESLYQDAIDYLREKLAVTELESKIEFTENAEDVIRMAEIELEILDQAESEYEFLALNHPDPNIRLIASWDYEEIQDLIEAGDGGGEKQFQIVNYELQKEDYERQVMNRLNEKIKDDPKLSRMKQRYERYQTRERKGLRSKYEARTESRMKKQICSLRNHYSWIKLRRIKPNAIYWKHEL
ncbi:MAG: hypothetical protein IPL53_20595 [Ignavibacteria bacterium]|nr:hypothetical protein [Ignavibacteria bacterium]